MRHFQSSLLVCTLPFVPGKETCAEANRLSRNSALRKAPSIASASRGQNPAPAKSGEMEQRSGSQLLFLIILGIFCSEVLASSAKGTVNRHKIPAKRYLAMHHGVGGACMNCELHHMMANRSDTNLIDEQEPVKRQVDDPSTPLYSHELERLQLPNRIRDLLAEMERQERLNKAKMEGTMDVPETASSEND
ncbi:hypothetical protein lerEdw1_020918 [Lerista edwardsae]|nr:hypothetical protein lerEdw1_020918 [Lerista edwardsae]